jgi:glycosyltransferase involved in cell wall biosynthesis
MTAMGKDVAPRFAARNDVSALADNSQVSVIFMRRLLPLRLYPGRAHVGATLTDLQLPATVQTYDGVDWYWLPSLARAIAFLLRRRPQVVLFQWWTGTVLHSYLALAATARLLRARVVIEFHETLDTGEERLRWAAKYVDTLAPVLFRLAHAYVAHSQFERDALRERYSLEAGAIDIIPHATYGHYRRGRSWRPAPSESCNLLYLGVIRPFKGVEDLIRAFDSLTADEVQDYWLTIVGETWEGCTEPGRLIQQSPYRDRITFVNRYVTDEEVDAAFGGADVVVLPYRRSSQSGPLHIAMHYGLPIVTTAVGGLIEAVEGYGGSILTAPGDHAALAAAIRRARRLRGRRFASPRGWDATAVALAATFAPKPVQ